jgi:hypothetical protein
MNFGMAKAPAPGRLGNSLILKEIDQQLAQQCNSVRFTCGHEILRRMIPLSRAIPFEHPRRCFLRHSNGYPQLLCRQSNHSMLPWPMLRRVPISAAIPARKSRCTSRRPSQRLALPRTSNLVTFSSFVTNAKTRALSFQYFAHSLPNTISRIPNHCNSLRTLCQKHPGVGSIALYAWSRGVRICEMPAGGWLEGRA